MNFSQTMLPSNKKFGFFFTLVFIIASGYFQINSQFNFVFIFVLMAIVLLLITIIKAEILLPLNKIWLNMGIILGMIISPIVLSAIFFGIFTPTAILMRLFGRDELFLKFKIRNSFWILKNESIQTNSFKSQF